MSEVFITRLAKYFPNNPVGNGEIEDYLGLIGGKPSRVKNIILRSNGIKNRYYALDKNQRPTHTNADLSCLAIRELLKTGRPASLRDIDLLALGTSTPDHIIPNHTTMVHGLLTDSPAMEAVFNGGSCCSAMQSFKYACMALWSGNKNRAITGGSERCSRLLVAEKFEKEIENLKLLEENPILAFEKDFLRWMLSDGAGVALLEKEPDPDGLSFRIDWVEILSYANELETCMYFAADKNPDGTVTGFADMAPEDWLKNSVFNIKQDIKILKENITRYGGRFAQDLKRLRGLDAAKLDCFLPHLSSEFFRKPLQEDLRAAGFDVPEEKWFTNLTRVGNVGSASAFLMLEELWTSGRLKKGQTIFLSVPESARFTYAGVHLTVV